MADKVDLNALIEAEKKKREAALAASKVEEAKGLKKKDLTDEANKVVLQANNKFDYANNLQPSIQEYEFTINFMAKKIARGDKLRPDEQDQLDFALKNYPKLTDAYTKAMAEGNKILATIPKGAKSTYTVKTESKTPAGTQVTKDGQVEGTGNTGPTVEDQNAEIDKLVKGARTKLIRMSDPERIALAKTLTDAGYVTPAIGSFNETLYNMYTAALGAVKIDNTANSYAIKSGDVPALDFPSFLAKQTVIQNQIKGVEGSGSGSGDNGISQRISDPTQAAGYVNTVFSEIFDRDATPQEVKALSSVLIDFEKKNPFKTVDGKTTGGLDREQFLTDVIKKGTYSGNPKAFPKILAKLGQEVATLKTNKEEGAALDNRQAILETARSNGITVSDAQMGEYLEQIKLGKKLTAIQQGIRDIVSVGYPDNVKRLIAEGNDLATIYSPYRKAMATELDLNENTISLDDPSLRSAIGPDKEMTIYDFQKNLRRDPRWEYTENARNEAASLVSKVLKDFGFMG